MLNGNEVVPLDVVVKIANDPVIVFPFRVPVNVKRWLLPEAAVAVMPSLLPVTAPVKSTENGFAVQVVPDVTVMLTSCVPLAVPVIVPLEFVVISTERVADVLIAYSHVPDTATPM